MGRKINIGCGDHVLEGFENVDGQRVGMNPKIIIGNALEYNYQGADQVYAGHFVEHLSVDDARKLFRKVRSDAPEAELIITIPAIERSNKVPFWWLQIIVFGSKRWPGDNHVSAWRTNDLDAELRSAGFTRIQEWPDCPYLMERVDWQVCLRAMS